MKTESEIKRGDGRVLKRWPKKPVTMKREEMARRVAELAQLGLAEHQVRALVGLDKDDFNLNFAAAYEAGRAEGVSKVADALRTRALDPEARDAVQAQIFYLKTRGGWSETQTHRFTDDDGSALAPIINLTIGEKRDGRN